jgi:hypothetical protein
MVFVGFKKPWSFHFWPTNLLAAFSAHSRLLWPYPLHHPGIVYYRGQFDLKKDVSCIFVNWVGKTLLNMYMSPEILQFRQLCN